jgi:uncharacterized protein (TIGR02246 family)
MVIMISELFQAIDSKDAKAFASFFSPDSRFVFGNVPPVAGVEEIRKFVAGFFDSIAALSHRIEGNWDIPGGLVCHGQVTYTCHDGSTLTVPFANILKVGSSGITEYLIFADTSQLFQ